MADLKRRNERAERDLQRVAASDPDEALVSPTKSFASPFSSNAMRDSRVANALPNAPAPRVGGGRTETPFGSGTGSVHQSRSALSLALGLCHWREWLTWHSCSLGRPQACLAAVPALVEPFELAAAALAFPRPPLGVASPYPHSASFRLSRESFLLSCYASACSLAPSRSVQTRRPSFPSPRRVALLAGPLLSVAPTARIRYIPCLLSLGLLYSPVRAMDTVSQRAARREVLRGEGEPKVEGACHRAPTPVPAPVRGEY